MLYLELLFFLVFGYYVYHFIQVLIRMGHNIVLPTSEDEISAIRKQPEKPLEYPSLQVQKVGILIYSGMLLFVFIMYVLLFFFRDSENHFNWALYLTLILPFTYTEVLNLFAVLDDGILVGGKFISWGRIKEYQFIPIDMNHRFYGYDREVNKAYELKIKEKFRTYSLIVMTEEMKGKLEQLLNNHMDTKLYGEQKIAEKKEGVNQ